MQGTRGAVLTAGDSGSVARTVRRRRLLVVFAVIAAVALAADQTAKALVVAHLTEYSSVTVVPHVLWLTRITNSGAAFSLAAGFTAVLTVIAVGVVVVVIRLSSRLGSRGWTVALGLLLGGALGNLSDRFLRAPGPLRGHVVDFLQLPHWPIFNVADMCVTVGAVLIAVLTLRGIGIDGRRARAAEESSEESAGEPAEESTVHAAEPATDHPAERTSSGTSAPTRDADPVEPAARDDNR